MPVVRTKVTPEEGRIAKAIEALNTGEHKLVLEAHKAFNVPYKKLLGRYRHGAKALHASSPYTSTAQYFLRVAEEKFDHPLRQQNSIDNRRDVIKKLNRRRLFRSITPQFVCSEFNRGPFPLVCDDFRPGNMLVRDGKIVAVFDWEWTYVDR
jgi:hypothetical protein